MRIPAGAPVWLIRSVNSVQASRPCRPHSESCVYDIERGHSQSGVRPCNTHPQLARSHQLAREEAIGPTNPPSLG